MSLDKSKILVINDGTLIAESGRINFIAGTNITLTVDANPNTNAVDLTIESTGGGGSGLTQSQVEGLI